MTRVIREMLRIFDFFLGCLGVACISCFRLFRLYDFCAHAWHAGTATVSELCSRRGQLRPQTEAEPLISIPSRLCIQCSVIMNIAFLAIFHVNFKHLSHGNIWLSTSLGIRHLGHACRCGQHLVTGLSFMAHGFAVLSESKKLRSTPFMLCTRSSLRSASCAVLHGICAGLGNNLPWPFNYIAA